MKERIAILTNFQDFNPGYSLTGIVSDQYRMLSYYEHPVSVFTCERFNHPTIPDYMKGDVKQVIPFGHLTDYTTKTKLSNDHKKLVQDTTDVFVREFANYNVVFSHDTTFTGWNMPYGLALIEAAKRLPKLRVFHWIHSIPTRMSDWWDFNSWSPNNRLIYPNKTDAIQVAEQYRTSLHAVRCIHHIKDLRTFWDFHQETQDFIHQHPDVMSADVVQVYPASVDRLAAKRVKEAIIVFSEMKKLGKRVCLVIANQWATDRLRKEQVSNYRAVAGSVGLIPNTEVIFTSDFNPPNYEAGIPKYMLRELMLCSNYFLFPTREESFGLVLPEAGLSGVLGMFNKSLRHLSEISGGHGLFFDFGSYNQRITQTNSSKYYRDLAYISLGRMSRNESIMLKTFCRQKFNWNYLYENEYLPLIAESTTWK